MSDQPYKRPPITEAVIEIRFANPLPSSEIDKAIRQLASVYSHQESVRTFNFAVGAPPGGEPQAATVINTGQRLSSDDLTQMVLLWPASFAVAQLAPYPGWDEFFPRFSRDWRLWKKAVDYQKIMRVGVRFINRIDVPSSNNAAINEPDFLNVYPTLPKSLRPVASYGVQAQLHLPDIECGLLINSGAVPSPLIGYSSYLLDFDIYREPEPPQSDEGIYELLNRIRVKKNEVFEACVTDRAKETFRE
jgi:uncharacterized protein (TIGR04255 family)